MADRLEQPMDEGRPIAVYVLAAVIALLMAGSGLALTVAFLLIP
jgi:hypothetical protein